MERRIMREMQDRRRSMRDMRHRSPRTGRYVADRMRGYDDYDFAREPRNDYGWDRDYNYDRREEMREVYPISIRGEVGRMRDRDYNYGRARDMRYSRDYAKNQDYLSDEELMEWSKDLLSEVDDQYKSFFTKDNIERKAKEKGINFEEFTFPELYVSTLMTFTDYSKVIGTGNMDIYILMGKEFLCDPDAEVRYGAKLAKYYDSIVCGE